MSLNMLILASVIVTILIVLLVLKQRELSLPENIREVN